jgi:hypothetical protein
VQTGRDLKRIINIIAKWRPIATGIARSGGRFISHQQ